MKLIGCYLLFHMLEKWPSKTLECQIICYFMQFMKAIARLKYELCIIITRRGCGIFYSRCCFIEEITHLALAEHLD